MDNKLPGSNVVVESLAKAERIATPNPARGLVFETERQRNVAFIQKGITKPGRISYDVLRRASWSVHVARICINVLKEKVTKTKWVIKPIDPQKQKSAKDDKRIKELTELFRHPNKNGETMRTILDKMLEDLLVLDSVSLEKTRYPDGKLAELHFVDSATIRPVFDERGNQDVEIPLNTEGEGARLMPVSYVQVLNNSQYGGPESGEIVAAWPKRDFIHFNMHPQGSMEGIGYGLSPIEGVLSVVANILNADNYNGNYFEDGAFPPIILHIKGQISQRDIEAYRQYLQSELMGNFHRPAVAAGGQDIELLNLKGQSNRDMEFMEYTKFLARLLAAAYGLSGQDIGLTEEVGSKNVSETNMILTNQKGYGSILHLLKEVFNQDIIWNDFGYDDLEFDWVADDAIPPKDLAEIHDKQLRAGTITLNEARQEAGKEPFGEWADKPMVLTGDGYRLIESDEEGDDAESSIGGEEEGDHDGETEEEEAKIAIDKDKTEKDSRPSTKKSAVRSLMQAVKKSLFNRPTEYMFDGLAMFGALVSDKSVRDRVSKEFNQRDIKAVSKGFKVKSSTYSLGEASKILTSYVIDNPSGMGGVLPVEDARGLRFDVYVNI